MGTCRKKKFRRKIEAKLALAFKGNNPNRREIRYYWHEECHAYHLTSQEKHSRKADSKDAGKRDNSMAARDNSKESH